MEANTRSRAELKSYFVKNAIPTESNFAELIDGGINKEDDGLIKAPGNPLSIEAGGDSSSSKPAIHLYSDFSTPNPDWILNLNPRTNPNNAATARAGFNISDGNGRSRLFIDGSTGNLGVGTIEPTHILHVKANGAVGLFESTSNQAFLRFSTTEGLNNRVEIANRPGGRLSLWTAGGGDVFNIERGGNVGIRTTNPRVTLDVNGLVMAGKLTIGPWPTNRANYVFFGTNALNQASAGNYALLQDSAGDGLGRTFLNSPVDIRFRINNVDKMVLRDDGDVGIGTSSPSARLHVSGGLTILQQQGWQNASLKNGWVNYSSTYNTAAYFKDSQGIVHLKGLVKSGTIRTAIFTLPSGYRPARRELQATATHPNAFGRCDILANGDVTAHVGSSGWFSLDGITFRAATAVRVPPLVGTGPIARPTP